MNKLKKKRIGPIILVFLFVIGMGAFGFISANRESDAPVKLLTVAKGTISISTSADGRAVADSATGLNFTGAGSIAEIYVEEGQAVKKDQKLAKLNAHQFSYQLLQAKAGYAVAKAKLNALKGGPSSAEVAAKRTAIENADITVSGAQADYNYSLDEYKAGRLSKEQLIQKETQLHNAEAQLRSAEAQLNLLLADPSPITLYSKENAINNSQIAVDSAQKAYDYALDEYNTSTETSSAPFDKLLSKEKELNSAKAQYDSVAYQLKIAREGPALAETVSKQVAIDNAKVALADAQTAYDYTLDAYTAGRLSKEHLSARETQLNSAKAQLKTAEAQLATVLEPASSNDIAAAKASVDQAYAAVKVAGLAVDETVLRAPVDGTVLSINSKVGETIGGQNAAGQPFMVIGNIEGMVVEAQVEEIDIAKISISQKVNLTFDALEGETFSGSVASIENRAQVDQNGVVTYIVSAVVENKNKKIKDGMTAHVEFIFKEAKDVLVIPVKAVSRINGKPTVIVKTNAGKMVRKQVELGITDGSLVEVKKGLSLDEKVVIKEEVKKE